jgi:nucleoid DNA-binding protein
VTHAEVIKILALRFGRSQAEIKRLLKTSTEIIRKILDEDISLNLPGLGSFQVYVRQPRKSFNPRYKKLMMLPSKRLLRFRPSASIKRKVKGTRLKNG